MPPLMATTPKRSHPSKPTMYSIAYSFVTTAFVSQILSVEVLTLWQKEEPVEAKQYITVYAILNKRRNLTTITNDNLSRIEENNKTPYQGACLNLIYKFDFGKKVKVKRAESIQTTSDSYLRK